eukprot:8307034-Prorocentrum_lima.AAC.1
MIGTMEAHTREEANRYLHEHYCDAERRWRRFTGRPLRKHRFPLQAMVRRGKGGASVPVC